MIQHILVPLDGSAHANHAVDLAADLANRYGAKLTVLHVTPDFRWATVPRDLVEFANAEHLGPGELMQGLSEKLLNAAAQRAKQLGAVDVTCIAEFGDPASCIVDHARSHSCDAIVLGSRGLSDIQGLLFGSVAHKVTHLSACTCITVRPPRAPDEGANAG